MTLVPKERNTSPFSFECFMDDSENKKLVSLQVCSLEELFQTSLANHQYLRLSGQFKEEVYYINLNLTTAMVTM